MTDNAGAATLWLPTPLPAGAQVAAPEAVNQCDVDAVFDPSRILKSGGTSGDTCDPTGRLTEQFAFHTVAGRFVFFGVPWCCLPWKGPPPKIRVTLLDGGSGRPMHGTVLVGTRSLAGATMPFKLSRKGTVEIQLPAAVPRQFVASQSGRYACSGGWVSVADILRKGVVDRDHCSHGRWYPPSVKPGELVIFGGHAGLFDWLFP